MAVTRQSLVPYAQEIATCLPLRLRFTPLWEQALALT